MDKLEFSPLFPVAFAVFAVMWSAQAAVVLVCQEGCDYSIIQMAIDAADEGDMVSVQGGTYRENVNVTKRITLRGVERPSIDAMGRGDAMTIYAEGAILAGIRVLNASGSGIRAASGGNVIASCDVEGSTTGIAIEGDGNIVTECNVSDNSAGVSLLNSSDAVLAYSNVGNSSNGIVLTKVRSSVVKQCIIQNCSGTGIFLDGSEGNSITGNVIEDNDIGVRLERSRENLVYQNLLLNQENAYDDGTNLWDNGTRGNYYGGCKGPASEGVCESAERILGGDNADRHPVAGWAPIPEGVFDRISPDLAYEMIGNNSSRIEVLDVRTPAEYESGHIYGASNLDYYSKDFLSRLRLMDKEKRYITYCRTGYRAGVTLMIMKALGFKEVYNISGGIVAWAEEGLPLVP